GIHIHLHHEHDDGNEKHCELCELAMDFINGEFSSDYTGQLVEYTQKTNLHSPKIYYNSIFIITYTDCNLFGRPPPSFI
ncbi:MAG: hypothetical protein AAGH81_02525, partial [Bacteroidota bacterium]